MFIALLTSFRLLWIDFDLFWNLPVPTSPIDRSLSDWKSESWLLLDEQLGEGIIWWEPELIVAMFGIRETEPP